MPDNVQLEVDGKNFQGWKKVTIKHSMETLCGAFSIELYDKQDSQTNDIDEGSACKISLVNDETKARDLILTGYIDEVNRRESSSSTSMTIKGRDRTSDLVDCSAEHTSNTWIQVRLQDLCKELADPFGILVDDSELEQLDPIKKFTLQMGETAYSAIERIIRSKAVLATTNSDSDLVLTYSADASTKSEENLEVGKNVLEIEETRTSQKRFSKYICRGQTSGRGKKWSKQNTRLIADAIDEEITRYRPHIFMAENKATSDGLKARVAWEAQIRAGRARVYTVTVKGWYQTDYFGAKVKPWEINERVNLKWTRRNIDKQFLITSVAHRLAEGTGRTTTLVLKNVDIFKANPTEKVQLAP